MLDFTTLEPFSKITLAKQDLTYTVEAMDIERDNKLWYKHTNTYGLYTDYALKKTIMVINELLSIGYTIIDMHKK